MDKKIDKAIAPAEQALKDAALEYHRSPTRGKISVTPTKPLSNQRDLSLAYSPGVAYACLAIEADPQTVVARGAAMLPAIAWRCASIWSINAASKGFCSAFRLSLSAARLTIQLRRSAACSGVMPAPRWQPP